VGDLAPRPRGGWQVGTHLSQLRRVAAGLEGKGDPAPDCCTVARVAEGVFLVRHFPSADAARPCCRPVRVTRRAEEHDIDALARAWRLIEQQHGTRTDTRPARERNDQ
jgi:hypothetical protein